jgi:hypothetical protein
MIASIFFMRLGPPIVLAGRNDTVRFRKPQSMNRARLVRDRSHRQNLSKADGSATMNAITRRTNDVEGGKPTRGKTKSAYKMGEEAIF